MVRKVFFLEPVRVENADVSVPTNFIRSRLRREVDDMALSRIFDISFFLCFLFASRTHLSQNLWSTSLYTHWFARTIFLSSTSTKKLNESICCFTKPLTLRKAGKRFHLSLAVFIGSFKPLP